jgi:hypothetical protein
MEGQPKSLGYYELKKHKPWFDERCYKLIHQKKQAKLQWLQDPYEINGDNLNNVRRETSRHFRNEIWDSIVIAKCKTYKSPDSDQIQAGGETLLSAIHKLINSVWNKEELHNQWMESIIVPFHQVHDKTD